MIGVVHNVPVPAGHAFSESSLDVLAQVEAVEKALEQLGYRSVRIPFTRDVGGFIQQINQSRVEIAINLCESVDDDPRFIAHPAAVLELLGIPFSGSPSAALMLTTDKAVAKNLLNANGIKTPHHAIYDGKEEPDPGLLRFPVILKPIFQDASIGIDQESIVKNSRELKERVKKFFNRFGALLVEEYIAGREFNVSIFGYPSPRALPLAEIDFSSFPDELYPIVGYRAKWDSSSFEYSHTPRDFPQNLPPILRQRIVATALECFHLLGLRDYGRVDMRVDVHGQIHVLEVNANPCLSPDAGFAAAVDEAGVTYSDMVRELLDFVKLRSRSNENQASHNS
jgi:D-alanine-D-alanine ligase